MKKQLLGFNLINYLNAVFNLQRDVLLQLSVARVKRREIGGANNRKAREMYQMTKSCAVE